MPANNTINKTTFFWIIGLLVGLVCGLLAVEWNVIISINQRVNKIAETQQKYIGVYEAMTDNRRRNNDR